MRLLLLSHWNPFVPGGVSLRLRALLYGLPEDVSVDVVHLDFPPGAVTVASDHRPGVRFFKVLADVVPVAERAPINASIPRRGFRRWVIQTWPGVAYVLRRLKLSLRPPQPPENFAAITSPYRNALHKEICERIHSDGGYDVLDVDSILAPWLPECAWSIPRAITFLDVVTEAVRTSAALADPRLAYDWALHLRYVRRFELALTKAADVSLTVSDRERDSLRLISPGASVTAVRNALPLELYQPTGRRQEDSLIVFSGRMSNAPNIDAVTHFVRELLPTIIDAVPAAKLAIVGADPPPEVSSLTSPHVQVVGGVDDMLPWLERASVVVAPLRTGGGTRLKVLEALAMGAALVATSEACSGLALVDEEHCLIREPTPEFANAVVRLLSDQPQRLRLGAQGRCMVEELYASRASGAEALQGYLAAIDLAKRPARQLVRARRMRDVNVA